MGDIAEAMLDGTLCEGCGEHIGTDAGYPQYCSDECAAGRGALVYKTPTPDGKPFRCNDCLRRFGSDEARNQHRRDKHDVRADIADEHRLQRDRLLRTMRMYAKSPPLIAAQEAVAEVEAAMAECGE